MPGCKNSAFIVFRLSYGTGQYTLKNDDQPITVLIGQGSSTSMFLVLTQGLP